MDSKREVEEVRTSDLTVGETGFDNERPTLADSWSGERVAAGGTFTRSTCVGFNNAPGGFGGSTIEGAVLGTKGGKGIGSAPCVAPSGPLDDPCGVGGADTRHSQPKHRS